MTRNWILKTSPKDEGNSLQMKFPQYWTPILITVRKYKYADLRNSRERKKILSQIGKSNSILVETRGRHSNPNTERLRLIVHVHLSLAGEPYASRFEVRKSFTSFLHYWCLFATAICLRISKKLYAWAVHFLWLSQYVY